MSEMWGISLSFTNRWPKSHVFSTISLLRPKGNFKGLYIFGMKHDINKRANASSKRHELWSTNGFKLEVSFHTPTITSALHSLLGLADGDQQTEFNETLPNGGR